MKPPEPCWQPDAAGWIPTCQAMPSPNRDERPKGMAIDLLVIHAISLPPGKFGSNAVSDFFCNQLDRNAHPYFASIATQRVSSHFFIRRDGSVIQFVSCLARAWHAGRSCWRGRECCNDFSIGIELEGDDRTPFTEPQYDVLHRLVNGLKSAYPVTAIAGHADIAPGRKTDPGPCFDWHHIQSGSSVVPSQRRQCIHRGTACK